MTLARQSNGVEEFDVASFAGDSKINQIKVARFAKLAIAACTAIMLVGLYIGTKRSFAVGSFGAEQSRVFHLDISEACLHSTEPPPVFEAQEGDHIALA